MADTSAIPPALVFLLPLVGGYALNQGCEYTRYHSAREQGHRLYFRALFYGIVLFTCAFLARLLLIAFCAWYRKFELSLADMASMLGGTAIPNLADPITLSAVYAFWLGLVLIPLLNQTMRVQSVRLGAIRGAIKDDDIECLLFDSILNRQPVRVSLLNRKEYIGFVLSNIDPQKHERGALTMLPLASGFRDDEEQDLYISRTYEDIYEEIQGEKAGDTDGTEDFRIAIPLANISTLSFFDFQHFVRFLDREGPIPKAPLTQFRRRMVWRSGQSCA